MRICDVCKGVPRTVGNTAAPKQVTVTMVTEQNEGRPCKPYKESKNLDLCGSCSKKIKHGAYIQGSGAMGYNSYSLKVPTEYDKATKIVENLTEEEKKALKELL